MYYVSLIQNDSLKKQLQLYMYRLDCVGLWTLLTVTVGDGYTKIQWGFHM